MAVSDTRLSLSTLLMLVIYLFLLVFFFSLCLTICLLLLSGLVNALNLIKHIKDMYSGISYADLFQLASATAIEVNPEPTFTGHGHIYLVTRISEIQEAGGPKIPMKYGRVDTSGPHECPEEGRLPGISTLIYGCFLWLRHIISKFILISIVIPVFYRRWSSFTG